MTQVIAKIDRSHYRTVLSNGRHELHGDEPSPQGTDTGPTPYDYLLMALGSCISMTLRMYADRKSWPLESVEVRLSQKRVHASDCETAESVDGFVHKITKEVMLTGDLSDDQRTRLMEIANKCPVYKTLTNEILIESA